MNRPRPLPCITDTPKEAFLVGWWSGIGVGFVLALCLAVTVWSAMKGS